jgi:hypothetical protein
MFNVYPHPHTNTDYLKHINFQVHLVLSFILLLLFSKHTQLMPQVLNVFPKMLAMAQHYIGLAYQSKDIVFRFIIEYNNLRDFGP